jgi:hypothetical protein
VSSNQALSNQSSESATEDAVFATEDDTAEQIRFEECVFNQFSSLNQFI